MVLSDGYYIGQITDVTTIHMIQRPQEEVFRLKKTSIVCYSQG